jgi:hypothetical protein
MSPKNALAMFKAGEDFAKRRKSNVRNIHEDA